MLDRDDARYLDLSVEELEAGLEGHGKGLGFEQTLEFDAFVRHIGGRTNALLALNLLRGLDAA